MPYQHFQIPCSGGEPEVALNRFLQERRILKVEKQFVPSGLDSFWAYHIHYDTGSFQATISDPSKKGMIDYKSLLTDEEFTLFLKLKDWRKERAQKDGVEAFTIFTNAQLADVTKKRCTSVASLREVNGIGDARVEKYAQEILAVIRAVNEIMT